MALAVLGALIFSLVAKVVKRRRKKEDTVDEELWG